MQETAKFLGHGVCDAINRSTTTNYLLYEASNIFKEIKTIYLRQNLTPNDLRGIGIQLSRLEKENSTTNGVLKKFLTNTHEHQDKKNNITKDMHVKRDLFASDKTVKPEHKKLAANNTQNNQKNAKETNHNLNNYFRNVKPSFGGKNKVKLRYL